MERRPSGELKVDTTSVRPAAIQALPPQVIAQIKSSTTITTLSSAVIGLLKNSVDANATKLTIDVDFTRGNCTVEDNGSGIPSSEFAEKGGLVKLYHTSKYAVSSQGRTYGTNGTFLASLGAMCLMTVTSRHVKHYSTNSLVVHHSNVKSRLIPSPTAHALAGKGSGTRVVVRDLFGNMAVRVKQRALLAEDAGEMERLWEQMRGSVVALLIGFGEPVSLKLRDIVTGKSFNFTPPGVLSTDGRALSPKHNLAVALLSQGHKLPASISASWIPASASSSSITVKALISLTPSASRSIQYISFALHPLSRPTHPTLYEHINKLFSRSHFGALPEEELSIEEQERRTRDRRFKTDGVTRKQMMIEKGVERWPMFVVWIDLKGSLTVANEDFVESEAGLGKIVQVLDALVVRWLEAHHFKPKKSSAITRSGTTASDKAMSDTSQQIFESRSRTPISQQQSPFQSLSGSRGTPRPYTGVPTVNALSRVKSSHNSPRPLPAAKRSRPESAPVTQESPLEQPAIEIETITSQWPALSRSKRSDQEKHRPDPEANVYSPPEVSEPVATETKTMIEDAYIDWVDPITKQKHRLNSRTGMRVRNTTTADQPCPGTQEPLARNSLASRFTLRSRGGTDDGQGTKWLDAMLQSWDNPVFRTREQPIQQTSFDLPLEKHQHAHTSKEMDRAFGEVSHLNANKISKNALRDAQVIAQVDEKFVLIRVKGGDVGGKSLLVAVDQHAADERIKVEELLKDLCRRPASNDLLVSSRTTGLTSAIRSSTLEKPLRFTISAAEAELFLKHAPHFAAWGILYDLTQLNPDGHILIVTTVPRLILERCISEPKLLINLLRRESWSRAESGASSSTLMIPTMDENEDDNAWIKKIGTCPRELLNMANSRACRSASMFNDVLDMPECRDLVRRLAECVFPFICAHGRPSMVPLIELGDQDTQSAFGSVDAVEEDYADAYARWQDGG